MNVSPRRALALVTLALLPAFAVCAGVAAQPDYEREARLANQIVDMILDGDALWLEANEREFLGIYTEADNVQAAVLILHGRGFHPDWGDAIKPLRVGLVARGYSTLSLQMPVLEKDAKYYDYEPIFSFAHARIEAGIRYLRDQDYRKVILLAHSCGAHMAMDWIRKHGDDSIDAYVGLGMGATDYGQPMRQPLPLARMQVAVLDVYGAEDYPAVRRGAPARKVMLQSTGQSQSQQQVIPQATHYYTDQGDALVKVVADWLDHLQ
ncbi:MAG TPA: alpha/beta fold hydrolase [Gammaproteobacteria bacterium]|nr:alpha/beta fold hydrolase [Gammaproteobacteria bacterium]